MTTPLLSLESEAAAELSNDEMKIPLAFGEKEVIYTAVDTRSLHSLSLSGVISSSS